MPKILCTSTDYMDDLLYAGRHYEKQELDAMMAYCASLGSTRHEWILDTVWALYDEDSPAGYDILDAACEAAHRHGMRFDVVFKPFEGALWPDKMVLPETLPRPADAPVLEEMCGIVDSVRPFLVEHPEMRLARRPNDAVDPGGRIKAIRLIKGDDKPASFGADDLSIWTSPVNGNDSYKRYDGPVTFSETVEQGWTYLPPRDQAFRVLTLSDLELPEDARYVLVRYAKQNPKGDFTNHIDRIVELVNERGQLIPCTPSQGLVDAEGLFERVNHSAKIGLSRYTRHPEVREMLQDREQFLAHCRGMRRFGAMANTHATFDQAGEVGVARGKPRHTVGILNPVHPEVRQHWLEQTQFCIDRGVDGVNFRLANHNRPMDPWNLGFNEPTLAQMTHPDNAAEAMRINGEAYTQFLREARDLLHQHKCQIGVHVHSLVFQPDNRHGGPWGSLPMNFDWQWETWVREIADYVEYRGANMVLPPNNQWIVERIGLAAREAGVPFFYQCTRGDGAIRFDGPYARLKAEMDWLREHPDVAGYNLYETANFMRMDQGDELKGSTDLAELVRQCWPIDATASV